MIALLALNTEHTSSDELLHGLHGLRRIEQLGSLTKTEALRLGGLLRQCGADTTLLPAYPRVVPRYVFKFGEMFPADDVLAEWMATLALAFNDLSLVRTRLGEDDTMPSRWFYWLRLGIAHFDEAASYLRETADIPEIAEFIDALPEQAQLHYGDCVARYEAHSSAIERIRNEAGFHYPELRIVLGQRRKRPMQKILKALADQPGRVEGETLGDARLLFADDVAAGLVLLAHGSDEMLDAPHDEQLQTLGPVHLEIEEGIASFVNFTNEALQTYYKRRIADGASWERLSQDGK